MSPHKITPDQGVSIGYLGEQVSSLSSQVSAYLTNHSHPSPSFEADGGAVPDDPEYAALRAALNDAALDLLRLVNGPKTTLRDLFFSHYDLAALQVALDRGFFRHVRLSPTATALADGNGKAGVVDEKPSSSSICSTVAEIAAGAGMDEDRTSAILKLLATHRIFEQVEDNDGKDGVVRPSFRHTAMSALLARDPEYHALGDMKLDDMLKASSELSTLVARSPHASSATDSAFQQRFGSPVYQFYEQNPEKGKRFAHAMSSWSKINERDTELRDSFPWESLGSGKIVDIGGGSGHISIGLAKEFTSLRFVVQDISPVQLSHDQLKNDSVGGRVTFQQHDFFQAQPVRDAAAFFLRQVLHNYNDEDSVRIIRALVPALEVSCEQDRLTPVLVNDVILPERGDETTRFEEHLVRQTDVAMMVILGAKQRSRRDWERLFKEADPRFQIVRVQKNPLGVGLVEVHLMC